MEGESRFFDESFWNQLDQGFMNLEQYHASIDRGELIRPNNRKDAVYFLEQYPDHPMNLKNKGQRIAAADRAARHWRKIGKEDLKRFHTRLFDCCAAVRLSLVRALMRVGDASSLPHLKRLRAVENESKMVATLAEIAITKIQSPDKVVENGSMIYLGDTENGMPHGEGRLFSSGLLQLIYEGGFKAGRFHGQGTRFNDDGSISRGRFDDGAFLG